MLKNQRVVDKEISDDITQYNEKRYDKVVSFFTFLLHALNKHSQLQNSGMYIHEQQKMKFNIQFEGVKVRWEAQSSHR